jgi:F0F1-type ATP synthase membrane subunit b/b'
MTGDPQQEYDAALADYHAAMARLREVRRRIDEIYQMKAEQRASEKRRLRREEWDRRHAANPAGRNP